MTIQLSPKKYKELEEELKRLETVERQKIAKHLRFAKELGDLSENSEYSQAREEEALLEKKILQIRDILAKAEIAVPQRKKKGVVGIGSVVTLLAKDKKQKFQIVNSQEANVAKGLISNDSPLGKSLLNKKKGEEIILETPSGKKKYKIIKVE